MQESTTAGKPTTGQQNATAPKRESDRNVLIYTGYAAGALALLGALAYHFSSQILR